MTVLQAELRAIASRLVMPEFMLTSDASNANYSSTMVAEGPAVKMFERLQWDMIVDDQKIMRMALEHAGIASELLDRVDIVAVPPKVQTRDRLKEAQADAIIQQAGAMSLETLAERNDLDWEVEKGRLDEERKDAAERAPNLLPQATDPTAATDTPPFGDSVDGGLPGEGGRISRSGAGALEASKALGVVIQTLKAGLWKGYECRT